MPTGSYAIGNRVFADRNNNGLLDPGETGLAGVTLRLRYNQVPTGRAVVTDATGAYLFSGLTAGTEYQVCVDPVPGFLGSNGSSVVPPTGGDPTAADANDIVDNDDNGKLLWDGSHCTTHIIVNSLRPTNHRVDVGLVRG